MIPAEIVTIVTKEEAASLHEYVKKMRGERYLRLQKQNLVRKWLDSNPQVKEKMAASGIITAYGSYLLEFTLLSDIP